MNAGRTSRSSDPNLGALYASWRCRSEGALSRTARFSPALALTFLPGSSWVPLADLVMAFARRPSTATQPWFLARSVVSLWVKSCRRRACRARSLAIWLWCGQPVRVAPTVVLLGPGDLAGLAALQPKQASSLPRGERRRHQARFLLVGDERRAGHPEVHPTARQAVRAGRAWWRSPHRTRHASRGHPWRRGVAHRTAKRAGQPKPHPSKLRQSHLSPSPRALANLDGLAGKRYRQAPPERLRNVGLPGRDGSDSTSCRGRGGRLAEHLLCALGGQVGQPWQVRAGGGEVGGTARPTGS